jgi:hypothetical protein
MAARVAPMAGGRRPVISDVQSEILLRTSANPLFRAARQDEHLVRIVVIRRQSIDSFPSTGNRPPTWARAGTARADHTQLRGPAHRGWPGGPGTC